MEDDPTDRSESLLPYDEWAEEALRSVAIRALATAAVNGMPGEHHFFVSFRTDSPGVTIPTRLLAQYPEEMTIVLQHQYWDLKVDENAGQFSVGLSFGGVPSVLIIPFGALTAFADPHVQFGLRFRPAPADAVESEPDDDSAGGPALLESEAPAGAPAEAPQVVSLDAFRRRKD